MYTNDIGGCCSTLEVAGFVGDENKREMIKELKGIVASLQKPHSGTNNLIAFTNDQDTPVAAEVFLECKFNKLYSYLGNHGGNVTVWGKALKDAT